MTRPIAITLCGTSLVVLLAGGCGGPDTPPAPPAGAIPAGQSIGSASLGGRVLFAGVPPPRRPIRMSGESVCHHPDSPSYSEDVIVGPEGGLRNAVVHVSSGLGDRVFAPPTEPVVMDQQGCLFIPHVVPAQVNQVVVFKNSDPIAHNVRSVSDRNRPFNLSMSTKGRSVRRHFSEPEFVKIRCDIHAWMNAWVPVVAHPFFAVTGDDGVFRIQGLPAGEYTLEAWHETLGRQSATVVVAEGGESAVSFTFAARAQ
jgi:plastocyanin